MEIMDLISVIVPVYNLQDVLTRSVKSICNQSYKNLEIIIVDDGSSDDSKTVIQELAKTDERIIPVYKTNEGVTAARLTGVRKASGVWIGFVDGDDEIEFDMYEKLYENAIKHKADISHCGYKMVFEDGRVNYFYNTGRLVQQDKLTGLKDLLAGSFIEPGLWNKLFRKNLFHSLLLDNLMDVSIKENEDLLMNFYLFKESQKSIYEDFCPYHYIVRTNSASRRKLSKDKLYDPITVKKLILRDCSSEIKEEAGVALLLTCLNAMNILTVEGGYIYKQEHNNIRKLILENDNKAFNISKKSRLLISLIKYCPLLYRLCYKVYYSKFQEKKYS